MIGIINHRGGVPNINTTIQPPFNTMRTGYRSRVSFSLLVNLCSSYENGSGAQVEVWKEKDGCETVFSSGYRPRYSSDVIRKSSKVTSADATSSPLQVNTPTLPLE
jgi:hypothetical protein